MARLAVRLLVVVGLVQILTGASARALTVDDFDIVDPSQNWSTYSNSSSFLDSTSIALPAPALGKTRKIWTKRLSGDFRVHVNVYSGVLSHSQDDTVAAETVVVWDGDTSSPTKVDSDGLGGVDLTQGAPGTPATAFIVKVGASHDIYNVRMEIRDAATGLVSSLTKPVPPTGPQSISFPFSEFTGSASFTNVGAILLTLQGNVPALDMSIYSVKTDDACELIPDESGRVYDECFKCGGDNSTCSDCFGTPWGNAVVDDCDVCGGDNSTCADCLGIPWGTATEDECGVCDGNNKDKDDCGVCFGNNRDLDDCGVCGGKNLSKDQCGICGGDNSSCVDCLGVPNGKAKEDVCGVCEGDGTSCIDCAGMPYGVAKLDRCGVCEGNGLSCLQCTETDLKELLKSMAIKSAEQRQLVRKAIRQLRDKKVRSLTNKESKKLYQLLLKTIGKLPTNILDCTPSEFCVTIHDYTTTVDKYGVDSYQLYKLIRKMIRTITREMKGGVCGGTNDDCVVTTTTSTRVVLKSRIRTAKAPTRTIEEDCRDRMVQRRRTIVDLRKTAQRLYQENIELSRKVPRITTKCD